MKNMRHSILALLRRILSHFGYTLAAPNISGVEPLHLWLADSDFLQIWDEIRPNTMIDITRAYMLYQFLLDVRRLEGAAAEVGVWRGGTGQIMAAVLAGHQIWLFDTFEGLPAISPEFDGDFHAAGDFQDTSYDYVKSLFAGDQMVKIVKGVFPHSIAEETTVPKKYCFVHIDVDLYQSAKDCCEYFYDLLVTDGVMIFDDYGFGTCPGVRQAVDEFFLNRPGRFYLPTGQYVVIKT